jgi:hypothetical protein
MADINEAISENATGIIDMFLSANRYSLKTEMFALAEFSFSSSGVSTVRNLGEQLWQEDLQKSNQIPLFFFFDCAITSMSVN